MLGFDMIGSDGNFEGNNEDGDVADIANLQPQLKKSQTFMNNPAFVHTFSKNYGKPDIQMKKATSAQIVRPQLSTLEATHQSAGSSINHENDDDVDGEMYTIND